METITYTMSNTNSIQDIPKTRRMISFRDMSLYVLRNENTYLTFRERKAFKESSGPLGDEMVLIIRNVTEIQEEL